MCHTQDFSSKKSLAILLVTIFASTSCLDIIILSRAITFEMAYVHCHFQSDSRSDLFE